MAKTRQQTPTVFAEIIANLGGIFRHFFPGVLLVAGSRLAYPGWFQDITLDSWPHLVVLTVIVITSGNLWFALNRYGFYQFVDYILYLIKSEGPVRGEKSFRYLNDLGNYTHESLTMVIPISKIQQHVSFRASTGLFTLTIGQILFFFGIFHSKLTVFDRHPYRSLGVGIAIIAIGIWQMIITRHIDFRYVKREEQ